MRSSNPHEPVRAEDRAETPPQGMSDVEVRWREAVVLWLRWNEAYERVTARMYEAGEDPAQLESLMDQMDQLRRQAIGLSHELLDSTL